MKKSLFLFSCVLLLCFTSCKKETSYTAEELTTNQLQKVISENGLKRVVAYKDGQGEPTRVSLTTGGKYSFSNGYVTIFDGSNDVSYNLAYLVNYEIKDLAIAQRYVHEEDKIEKTLFLVFK